MAFLFLKKKYQKQFFLPKLMKIVKNDAGSVCANVYWLLWMWLDIGVSDISIIFSSLVYM